MVVCSFTQSFAKLSQPGSSEVTFVIFDRDVQIVNLPDNRIMDIQ